MPVVIDGSNTPTAGGIGYGDGTELAFTSAGTNGQVLTSAGSSAPTWASPTVTSPAGTTGQVQINNAGAFGAVSSGTTGQVLTSQGTGAAPVFATPAAGGVTSVATSGGITGGTITSTGTISLDLYTGSSTTNTSYPIGTVVVCSVGVNAITRNESNAIKYGSVNDRVFVGSGESGTTLTGTWSSRGWFYIDNAPAGCLFQRVA